VADFTKKGKGEKRTGTTGEKKYTRPAIQKSSVPPETREWRRSMQKERCATQNNLHSRCEGGYKEKAINAHSLQEPRSRQVGEKGEGARGKERQPRSGKAERGKTEDPGKGVFLAESFRTIKREGPSKENRKREKTEKTGPRESAMGDLLVPKTGKKNKFKGKLKRMVFQKSLKGM